MTKPAEKAGFVYKRIMGVFHIRLHDSRGIEPDLLPKYTVKRGNKILNYINT
jgi:hypothetical protein